MAKNKKEIKFPSELRLDLTSKDWVVIATGRGKKPELFSQEKRATQQVPKENCPFCNIETQEKPVLIFNSGKKIDYSGTIPKDWTTIVVPNKFPSLLPNPKFEKKKEGDLYETMNAVGFCELVVTRDHEKSFSLLTWQEMKEVIDCYQLRYLALMEKKFVRYISIFHNFGAEAGASQPHNHSQIITTPLIDVDLRNALVNSKKYYQKTGHCLYCQMDKLDMEKKTRVIFENEGFLALCPFASKSAFEIIVSPKKHSPYFEKINDEEKIQLAQALKASLEKLYKALNDPPYNFYLHTAPCDGKEYPAYHWHWTILPKTSIWAGFEIGTRMEISVIEPEKAAEYLRKY